MHTNKAFKSKAHADMISYIRMSHFTIGKLFFKKNKSALKRCPKDTLLQLQENKKACMVCCHRLHCILFKDQAQVLASGQGIYSEEQ